MDRKDVKFNLIYDMLTKCINRSIKYALCIISTMKVIGKYVSIQIKMIPFEVFWFGRCLYHYKVQTFLKSEINL